MSTQLSITEIPVVILAGGLGTRISEETISKPKPMILIGDQPMLWHIMKYYHTFGFKKFYICLGYKGQVIKEYFYNYNISKNNLVIQNNNIKNINSINEDWIINLIDTGLDTQTGGRMKKILKFVKEDTFCLTYGDGLSNINLKKLITSHFKSNKLATITAVPMPSRFGVLTINKKNKVDSFREKPKPNIHSKEWINGGFFVLQKKVGKYIQSNSTRWEEKPLKKLAEEGNLNAFKHIDFWQPVDTLREKIYLNELWSNDSAPWKIW